MFENLKKAVERAQKEQEEKAYERACAACGESQTPHLLQEAFKFHESLAETGDMHFKK